MMNVGDEFMLKSGLVAVSLIMAGPVVGDDGMTTGLFGPGFHDMVIDYCWLISWQATNKLCP